MARKRAYKVDLMSKLEEQVASQKSVVLFTTNQAKVSLDSDMNIDFRKKAMESGVKVQILKNTLTKRLFEGIPELQGQTYISYLKDSQESDEITVPKAVVKLVKSKEFKDSFNLVGAVVNGEFIDPTKTEILSDTPSREDSFAMAAGAIKSLASKLARLTKEIPTQVARATNEMSKTKS
jgi:large subunit ribosomal protein L10